MVRGRKDLDGDCRYGYPRISRKMAGSQSSKQKSSLSSSKQGAATGICTVKVIDLEDHE